MVTGTGGHSRPHLIMSITAAGMFLRAALLNTGHLPSGMLSLDSACSRRTLLRD